MAHQTAVEWLEEKVRNFNDRKQTHYEYDQMFIQAKQMEKEHIINACIEFGNLNGVDIKDYEEYYNDTYNKL